MEIRWRAAARSWGSTITVLAPFLQTAAGLPGVSRPATTITKSPSHEEPLIKHCQGGASLLPSFQKRLPVPDDQTQVTSTNTSLVTTSDGKGGQPYDEEPLVEHWGLQGGPANHL